MQLFSFSIIPAIAAVILGTWGAAGQQSIFTDTVVDLDEVTAVSYDVQAVTFGLSSSNFNRESPKIVTGLYGMAVVGTKYIRQASNATEMDDEQARNAIDSLAIFVNAQQTLMNELIEKRGAEDALARVVPTREEEANALFHKMNGALDAALAAYY
ncbi:uncharacterized protein TRAVEDRAFT_19467 [Trametes versicolor FP-101664 SS1]|uniref:uncharacterized protein n=1 Tax=Trametes versicolor (strain FP-101664) TaxID=717944 RepID=UPI0004622D3E|nr:uncharacterized protein TRAVEDRAFT_19467 [Trametes versicolor FP-101664 SS1]EIW60939.1 hypothetical protein TRAVEDRAFT_19467 [Trametes versicolor FP-101664 SS1]